MTQPQTKHRHNAAMTAAFRNGPREPPQATQPRRPTLVAHAEPGGERCPRCDSVTLATVYAVRRSWADGNAGVHIGVRVTRCLAGCWQRNERTRRGVVG